MGGYTFQITEPPPAFRIRIHPHRSAATKISALEMDYTWEILYCQHSWCLEQHDIMVGLVYSEMFAPMLAFPSVSEIDVPFFP